MNTDLIAIIGNLSQSLLSVQAVVSGLGYLIGILFMIIAISKLKQIGDARARGSGQHKMFVPLAYFMGGAALIFLPSAVNVLSKTTFGSGNVLQYTNYNPYDVYSAMRVIIQTAGLIWFVRGSVLLVHASEPGVQHGPKGLAFIVAGILAMNFEDTIGMTDYFLTKLMSVTANHSATSS